MTTFEDTEVPPTITVSLLSLEVGAVFFISFHVLTASPQETRAASLCAIESAETVSTKEHDSLPAVSVEVSVTCTNDIRSVADDRHL